MLAHIDAKGRLREPPLKLRGAADGLATAVAIETADGTTRAALARSTPDEIVIDAIEIGSGTTRLFPLFALDGPPSLDVSLSLESGDLYFNDDAPDRARRATVTWKR
jgi:hypothetical protein